MADSAQEELIADPAQPQHEVISMSKRLRFVNKGDTTPMMTCPLCNYSGHGWQKFPRLSTCGKVSAGFLTIVCMCCLPFCCDCSITWEWMCPACHQCHVPDPSETQPQ